MEMDADARLAAAAGGVVRFFADAAGLENSVIAQLQLTVVTACTEAFEYLSRQHPHLGIDFTRFSDRLEVALSHPGDAARTNSGTPAGVDRVQYETHGAEVVTRLTKYLGKVTPIL